MQPEAFYRRVMDAIGDEDRAGAARATAAVFRALRDRLTVPEAAHVGAQLPAELKRVWQLGERADRQPQKTHRAEFYGRVAADGNLPPREARAATIAVLGALQAQLSPGESDDVLSQLPLDLKELWLEAGSGTLR
jgi:uncharacterized protein (DUF2267 family)